MICRYEHPQKDRVSILLLLKDKSRALNKVDELKRSITLPDPLIDLVDQKPSPPTSSVSKYSKQDVQ